MCTLVKARGFEKKPRTPLTLINPGLEQAGGGDISLCVAQVMDRPHAEHKRLVVFAQLAQHIFSSNIFRVVIGDALQARDLANGSNGEPADLAGALGNVVCHCEDLVGLVIEKQMVIAKVGATHVPMKILGFQIKSEYIRQKLVQGSCDLPDRFGQNVRWSLQWRNAASLQIILGGHLLLLAPRWRPFFNEAWESSRQGCPFALGRHRRRVLHYAGAFRAIAFCRERTRIEVCEGNTLE